MRRLICRLRGHVETTRTLRLGDESRDVSIYCRRCHTTLAERTDLVLLTLTFDGGWMPPLRCYANGQTGDCGHPLAECQGGQCGEPFCPQCGQWRCEHCQRFAEAMRSVLTEGLEGLDDLLPDRRVEDCPHNNTEGGSALMTMHCSDCGKRTG